MKTLKPKATAALTLPAWYPRRYAHCYNSPAQLKDAIALARHCANWYRTNGDSRFGDDGLPEVHEEAATALERRLNELTGEGEGA